MKRPQSFKLLLTYCFFFCLGFLFSQPVYHFTLSTSKNFCVKGIAALNIEERKPTDTISINWSSGESNVYQVHDLIEGSYNVHVVIKRHQDTLLFVKDTTLYFSIEKEFCQVSVDKYFSPNDDNYHDKMEISNTGYYPDFELDVYNKWGQRVHHQNHEYTPWDGKWNGIDLPDGTYYYVFFYDSSNRSLLVKGDVTILR